MDSKTIFQDILSLKYIRGVTFSGGEPLDQAVALAPLMKDLRGQGYNIWIYTGYTFEEAAADSLMSVVVRLADVLVDGRFVRSKRTLTIPFIGSENQRVIDVQESLRQGKVQLFTPRIVWIGKQTPHFNSGLYY
jgi:anaerobic ribonucleoside-triphosphate reductase activating protein